jgi:hypothetical protein
MSMSSHVIYATAAAPTFLNTLIITTARWLHLAPKLRTELRQVLGGKAAILNRLILDVPQALCARDAHVFDWHLYHGCGLGLLMDLRRLMGEDPAEIGETILV